jgi:acyl-coenzyme A thioesterase PaaI-like protein
MTPSDSSQAPLSGSEVIRAFFPRSPYVVHLGMQLTELHKDPAILTLPFQDALITIGTTVYGGVIASLIDAAAMVAAWSGTEASAHTGHHCCAHCQLSRSGAT